MAVTDWNNDGVKDLLIGTSVVTINGKYDPALSMEWEKVTDLVKKSDALFSMGLHAIIDSYSSICRFLKPNQALSDERTA